ncbi:prepilin peptidase [Enterococcus sp. BWM-S5]|uniref:Prepilin peptidase n=1 Tax=Enterococcus larvae TaxID=2794352 RepID=A0ABS4CMX2_9ENTE|nr:A24 family peptidase [Enterococcus larvae]MBP1047884.1 prepilin peptidase [Enterococcus larvae]
MTQVILFILGCCLGSFYCLIAERVPQGKSILSPASHCPYCRQRLSFYELIPLLSITTQQFQCRSCFKQLPIIYFISELAGGFLCVFCFAQGLHPSSLYLFLFLSMGLLLSLTDCFYLIVEPRIFYSFSITLLAWQLWCSFSLHLAAGLIISLFLCGLNKLFPQAIGGGDILLLGCWSLLLGWESILLLLFSASTSALLYSMTQQLLFRKRITQLPFVPFLTIGLFSVFLFK